VSLPAFPHAETALRTPRSNLAAPQSAAVTHLDSTAGGADIDEIFRNLRSLDVGDLNSVQLHEAMRIMRPLRGWIEHLDALLRRRAHELAMSPTSSHPDEDSSQDGTADDNNSRFAEWQEASRDSESLNHESGITSREGRRRDARARILARFPELADHLCEGRISADHIDAVADISRTAEPDIRGVLGNYSTEIISAALAHDPAKLRRVLAQIVTRIAADLGVERTERQRRARYLRHWMDVNGMGHISAQLEPDTYQQFAAILSSATHRVRHRDRVMSSNSLSDPDSQTADPNATNRNPAQRSTVDQGHLNIDTLMELVAAGSDHLSPDSHGRRNAVSMSVIIDNETLLTGLHASSICEYADGTPLDLSQARQLACEAHLLPVVLSGASVPLDVGRSQRTATSHQQMALQAIYATCAIPSCSTAVTQCEIHHIHRWENGGRTDLSNLIPLCGYHHHALHRERWKLKMDDRRELTVTLPDGTIMSAGPDRLTDFVTVPHPPQSTHPSQNSPVVRPTTQLHQRFPLGDRTAEEQLLD
jgi:hypothetical protein